MAAPSSSRSAYDPDPEKGLNGKSDQATIVAELEEEPDDIRDDVNITPVESALPLGEERERAEKESQLKTAVQEKDPNVVSWDGPDDPDNPQNWAFGKKWGAMGIVSAFTFMSPLSSSMVAPALPQMCQDLGIENGSTLSSMCLSIFVLGLALGPLVLAPLSEIHGRVRVLQIANAFFLIFNLVGGFSQTPGQMVAFRFLSGLGGGAPITLGAGVLGDLFSPEQRGLAQGLYSLGPLTGPAVGPLISGWIVERINWRWIFYITTMVDAVVQLLGVFWLRETYAPKLLGNKTRRLQKETGNLKLRSAYDRPDRSTRAILTKGMLRPMVFLATEPLCQIIATYMAVMYGVLYILLTTFAELWVGAYHESVGIAGLNYIAIGGGYTAGSQIGARLLDRVYKRMKAKNGGVGLPEFRVPIVLMTSPLAVVGLLWYGWSAQKQAYWLVPDVGIFIYGIGTMGAWLAIQTYLVDTFTLYAASAIGAAALYRSLLGFGFPLFANQLYARLGQGWGNTLLALITLLIGVPAPIIFFRYGHILREKSPMARMSKLI